jgi:hypothetical protein
VISHNAKFDMTILAWHFGIRPELIIDTLSMARVRYGNLFSLSLANLSTQLGLGVKGTTVTQMRGVSLKNFLSLPLSEQNAYVDYCRQDTELTYRLFKTLKPSVPLHELLLIDRTVRLFTEPSLRLDKTLLEERLERVHLQKAQAINRAMALLVIHQREGRQLTEAQAQVLRTAIMDEPEIARTLAEKIEDPKRELMSNNKFAFLLESLGVTPPRKISARTGKETYAFAKSDVGLTDLLEHENPAVQAVVAARIGTKSTIEETRTERFIGMADQPAVPVELTYWGAATTGRWSGKSSQKANWQNLPRGGVLRHAIKPQPGHVILAADQSNIELRVNHVNAGCEESIALLREGADLYCSFASVLYGREITKEDASERFMGKTCIVEGSLVLTHVGLVPIEDVSTDHFVWDGVEWVTHDGAVYMGEKEVICYDGVEATPDHEVFSTCGRKLPLIQAAKEGLCIVDSGAGRTPLGRSAVRGQNPAESVVSRAISGTDRRPVGGTIMQTKRRVWDILNAGLRHRFTVSDRLVSNCQLGLGYSCGPAKFKDMVRMLSSGKVSISMDESKEIVKTWRSTYMDIVALWRQADQALTAMYRGSEMQVGDSGVVWTFSDPDNYTCGFEMPRGRRIYYHDLQPSEDGWTYMTRSGRVKLYSGKAVENLTQSLARHILADQWLEIDRMLREGFPKWKIALQVHDELVMSGPEEEADTVMAQVVAIMRRSPIWWPDIPLEVEAHVGDSYGAVK